MSLAIVSCDSSREEFGNQSPRVDISVTSETVQVGTSVSFGADAVDLDGSIESYSWEFGDGTSASGPSTSHVYNTVGTFSVVLTVTDDDGASSSATQTLQVRQQFTRARITKVRLLDFPFTSGGFRWDPFSGPDPYYIALNAKEEEELAASLPPYRDVREDDLPLPYPNTEWTIDNLKETHAIEVLDADPERGRDDLIDRIEFDLGFAIGEYPESIILENQRTRIEVLIDWRE